MTSETPGVSMDSPEVIIILIILLIFILICTVGFLFWHSGMFDMPDIKTCKPPFQELEVAYKFVRGTHKDCSVVYAEAHSLLPELKCIGVYYDDPKEAGDVNMRSIVGVILNEENKTITEEDKQRMLVKGFQITKFPAVEHVVYTDFPHRSFLSVLVAVNKVVPNMRSYIQEKKLQAYPLIEICDGQLITYIAPLSKQSEFFVEETLVESEEEITSDKTVDESEEVSSKDVEELPDTISSVDSLMEGGSKVEELPSTEEVLDSLEDKNKASNGSEASTESFEELQLES